MGSVVYCPFGQTALRRYRSGYFDLMMRLIDCSVVALNKFSFGVFNKTLSIPIKVEF